jgi:hypothetical protein
VDDDGSSEGNFILAPPIATFKVFGTDQLATVTLVSLICGSLQPPQFFGRYRLLLLEDLGIDWNNST